MPISSANSTKAITRVTMSTLFVSLCSATSFRYSLCDGVLIKAPLLRISESWRVDAPTFVRSYQT